MGIYIRSNVLQATNPLIGSPNSAVFGPMYSPYLNYSFGAPDIAAVGTRVRPDNLISSRTLKKQKYSS